MSDWEPEPVLDWERLKSVFPLKSDFPHIVTLYNGGSYGFI